VIVMSASDITQKGTWREIEIIPSQHIASAVFYRRGKYKMIRLGIATVDGIYYLTVKNIAVKQFLNKVGLTITKLIRQRSYERMQEILWDAIVSTDNPIILSISPNDTVYRVTSFQYTPVPHRVLFDFVSGVLDEMQLPYQFKGVYRLGINTFATWRLPSMSNDVVDVYLRCRNANTGETSIKLYGYYTILVCRNGLTSSRLSSTIRIVHKSSLADILSRVRNALYELIPKLPTITRFIDEGKKIQLPRSIMLAWLKQYSKKKLPKELVRHLEREIAKTEETLFGLSQAITYVGTHVVKKPRWREMLQELGGKVLEGEIEVMV